MTWQEDSYDRWYPKITARFIPSQPDIKPLKIDAKILEMTAWHERIGRIL